MLFFLNKNNRNFPCFNQKPVHILHMQSNEVLPMSLLESSCSKAAAEKYASFKDRAGAKSRRIADRVSASLRARTPRVHFLPNSHVRAHALNHHHFPAGHSRCLGLHSFRRHILLGPRSPFPGLHIRRERQALPGRTVVLQLLGCALSRRKRRGRGAAHLMAATSGSSPRSGCRCSGRLLLRCWQACCTRAFGGKAARWLCAAL